MDQPRLVPDITYAVAAVSIQLRWVWPEGWQVVYAVRREGETDWTVLRDAHDGSEAMLTAVTGQLACDLGLA